MTLNIFQAAYELRYNESAAADLNVESCGDAYTDLYFIHHDALHTFLGLPPEHEYESMVLATELLLGGQDFSHLNVDGIKLSEGLQKLESETLEFFLSFYEGWFNR